MWSAQGKPYQKSIILAFLIISLHMFSENGRGGQQKGKKKFPMEVLFLAPVFLRHAEGKLREWNSALGYPWSTGRGSSFVATWGLCDCAYLFASLTGMCRCLILSFGERRLAKEGWPDSFVLAISLSARRIFSLFCLGFVFIFSFKVVVVVVNIFCRSIGGPRRQQLIWLELEDQEWRAESHWAVSEGAWLWKIWSQGWGQLSPAAVN